MNLTPKLGSRKYWFAFTCVNILITLRMLGKITSSNFSTAFIAVAAAYLGANVASKFSGGSND